MANNYPDANKNQNSNNQQNNTGANYGGQPAFNDETPIFDEVSAVVDDTDISEEIPPYEAPSIVPRTLAETDTKKGSGNSKLIIICISIVLIVAIIAAAVVFAITASNKKAEESSAQSDAPQAKENVEKSKPDDDSDDGLDLTEPEENPEHLTLLVTVPDKSGAMADMIMLCIFDFENKDISLLSVPRDMYISGKKLNELVCDGDVVNDEKLVSKVKEITGIPVHHYLRTDIDAVKDTVDLFGGVDFNVPQNMRYSDPAQNLYINLSKGYQNINGDEAEQLLRFRSYTDGDIGRTRTQRKFMIEAFNQHAIEENIELIPDWFEILDGHSETSLTPDAIADIADLIVEKDYELFDYVVPYNFVDGQSYVKCDYNGMKDLSKELGF